MKDGNSSNVTVGYWVWQVIVGLVLGGMAILSLPLIYGDLGGKR
ncbi:MAG: hypothetical protein R2873_28720 [Caldilineaceae bacterium]